MPRAPSNVQPSSLESHGWSERALSELTHLRLELAVPHAPEAERALLGGLLLRSDCYGEVATRLCEEDFHLAAHREIFSVMTALARTNMPIDTVTVREVLAQRGRLETVGGNDYLLGLTDTIPILDHLLSYAKLIHDRGRQRRLVARSIARLAALTSLKTSTARRQSRTA